MFCLLKSWHKCKNFRLETRNPRRGPWLLLIPCSPLGFRLGAEAQHRLGVRRWPRPPHPNPHLPNAGNGSAVWPWAPHPTSLRFGFHS